MFQLTIRKQLLLLGVFTAAVFFWTYWPTFAEMARRWNVEPIYSHGYLVPGFAAFLLWGRRDKLVVSRLSPSWWGLAFVFVGTAARLGGAYSGIHFPDRFSLPVVLVGICVGFGGWAALRWAWPGIAFLLFMIPLPAGFDSILARPLQRVATLASANALQTLGFIAEPEGNVILLRTGELGIVEACSGLRMFVTFWAITVAVAILIRRSLLQKLLIVVSAFPLAMACNVIRITLTGVVHETIGEEAARVVFHDVAGWLMIGFAVALLWGELRLLAYLFVPSQEEPAARAVPRLQVGPAQTLVREPATSNSPR